MNYRLDPMKCISEAFQAFTVYPWLSVGGIFLVIAMSAIGNSIPLLGLLFGFIVSPVLTLGMIHLANNISIGKNPELEDIFAGFKSFGRSLGVYWLWSLIGLIGFLPSFIAMMLLVFSAAEYDPYSSAPPISEGGFGLFLFVLLVNMVAMVAITMRWTMAFFVAVDEPYLSIIECFKRSSQITFGNRFSLFFFFILLGLMCVAGMLLFFVGYFIALPVAIIAMARAYHWLKSFHPPAFPTPRPEFTPPPSPDASPSAMQPPVHEPVDQAPRV